MARYDTKEKLYECPSPWCEIRFSEREAIVVAETHLVCPKCHDDALRAIGVRTQKIDHLLRFTLPKNG